MLHNTRAHTHTHDRPQSPESWLPRRKCISISRDLVWTLVSLPVTSQDYTSCVRRLFSMLLYELDCWEVDEALVTLWDKTQIILLFLR